MNEEKPIIAVDFDGTLVEDEFPLIGAIHKPIWEAMLKAKAEGCRIILWTCRNKEYLDAAVAFCRDNGLEFDAINENLPEVEELYGGYTRKIFANLYIDDRNGCFDNRGIVYYPTIGYGYGD